MPMLPPTPPIETPEAYQAKEQKPVGQQPVPGGLIGRAGVNVTSTVYRCGASSDGSGWLMVFIIFLLIVLFGRI